MIPKNTAQSTVELDKNVFVQLAIVKYLRLVPSFRVNFIPR